MTALQELISKLESFKKELTEKYDGDPLVTRGIYISVNEAKELLEKEKQQIINAHLSGQRNYDIYCNEYNENVAKEYYDDTYKQ